MTIVFSATLTGSEVGWGGYTTRQVIGAANLSAASGNQCRVTLTLKDVTNATTIIAYVGQGSTGGDAYDTTAMVQLTGGDFGSGTYTQSGTASGVVLVSDWVTLNEAYDEAKDYVVSCYSGGIGGLNLYKLSDANNSLHYSAATTNNASTANTSGQGSNGAFSQTVSKFEIQGSGVFKPIYYYGMNGIRNV